MNSKELEDVDDDLFISRKPQNYIFDETKDETARSLVNCKNLLYESEVAGRSALENLSIQREALERTESNLDTINAINRVTQKHLKNMRSFWGGVRSLFVDSSKDGQIKNDVKSLPKSATLAHLPNGSAYITSPEPTAGLSNMKDDYRAPSSSASASFQNSAIKENSHRLTKEPIDEYDSHLEDLGVGLGTLKSLAARLGEELEEQNNMLDRIGDKTDRVDDSIKHQNRHVRELLKK